jgi:hypothetical protein
MEECKPFYPLYRKREMATSLQKVERSSGWSMREHRNENDNAAYAGAD